MKTRAEGKPYKESGIVAGYPAKNAAQSAYQAIKGLRGRVADLLDNTGLSEQVGIEMYVKPALEATETIFAQKDGKFRDKREVVAWRPHIFGTANAVRAARKLRTVRSEGSSAVRRESCGDGYAAPTTTCDQRHAHEWETTGG